MSEAQNHLRDVISKFNVEPEQFSFVKISTGLINQSYKVLDSRDQATYFLQSIDHTIFKDIEGLMSNISVVINHLSNKSQINHLNLVKCRHQDEFVLKTSTAHWRLYHYVEGNTYYRAEDNCMASEAGRAYGEFLLAVSGINPNQLIETIPDFHNINRRYEQFAEAKIQALPERISVASELAHFVVLEIAGMKHYYAKLEETAKKRVTHNDTKLANLIFDHNGMAIIVVDYDTLMPGYLAFDFGDAIRTICSNTVEDSLDLAETFYNKDLIKAFSTAMVDQIKDIVEPGELKLLPESICYMPFIMGLRMLTDYLNNDVYYSTNYADHNLDRAKNQFALYASGKQLQNELNNIVG